MFEKPSGFSDRCDTPRPGYSFPPGPFSARKVLPDCCRCQTRAGCHGKSSQERVGEKATRTGRQAEAERNSEARSSHCGFRVSIRQIPESEQRVVADSVRTQKVEKTPLIHDPAISLKFDNHVAHDVRRTHWRTRIRF